MSYDESSKIKFRHIPTDRWMCRLLLLVYTIHRTFSIASCVATAVVCGLRFTYIHSFIKREIIAIFLQDSLLHLVIHELITAPERFLFNNKN